MATAAWFKLKGAQAGGPAVRHPLPDLHGGAYRLRALPHEDVYFHRKKIDNSRVVREADPQARNRCWRAIGLSSVAAALLIMMMLPNVLTRVSGYQLHFLQKQHEKLVNERAALELEEATLLSPERMEELARTLQLVDPMPGQVLLLNPKADGSLAYNVRGK